MMRFEVTRENPLHQQLSGLDCHLIDEITVKGFLCDADYELLTEMSGADGNLRTIDLYEVNETDCHCEYEYGAQEQVSIAIADFAFENSVKLKRIILPKLLEAIGSPTFGGCVNLKGIDFPESLRSIGSEAFQCCPNLGEIYIGKKLNLGNIYDCAFTDSASGFICDWNQWPVNKEGEPLYKEDGNGFFSHDGVLFFGYEWDEGVDLEKYPSNHERSIYHVPSGTESIKYGAFSNCKYLHKIIFPESCGVFTTGSICGCPELETLVFKGQVLDGERVHHMDLFWDNVITNCPKLQDIYLYAEEPSNISFGLFEDLGNIGDIILHVPCFCAQKYRQHEEECINVANSDDKKYIKCWQRFKRIEEFDPIDFFENGF